MASTGKVQVDPFTGMPRDFPRDGGGVFGKPQRAYMKRLLRQRVSDERYHHSLGVAKQARKLAKIYGQDPDQARMAGVLHDWDKGLSNLEVSARARELDVDAPDFVIEHMPWLLHGPTAAAALKREFPAFGDEVFQAIARHTSGARNMTPLDCIIYIADIIEPNRTFGDLQGIQRLRDLVGEVDLDELFFHAYKYTFTFLLTTDRMLYPATVDVWNELMETHGRIAKKGIDIWKR